MSLFIFKPILVLDVTSALLFVCMFSRFVSLTLFVIFVLFELVSGAYYFFTDIDNRPVARI